MEAEEVKQIRSKMGLSQRQFAKKMGVSFVQVWKWENGRAKPHPIIAEKILKLSETQDA
jgi:DNA-binding transcriptional regulator YiaG